MTVLLFLGLWFVQQTAQMPRHTVTGTVTNSLTGAPIYHAMVQMREQGSQSALTGPDGRFQFQDVAEGRITLVVTKPGFFDSGMPPLGAQIYKVTSGDNDFALKLIPAARIVGRLTDQDDEPIEQIPVTVLIDGIANGRKQWGTRGASLTDDDGVFRVDDLAPGRYAVFVAGRMIPDSNWDGHPHVFAPAYYPGGSDIASAQIIELKAGEEFQADFHLHAQRGFRVAGTITGSPAGLGITSFFQNTLGQNISWPIQINSKGGHWIAQALPAGDWNLVLESNDGQGTRYRAVEQISVGDSDIDNVQVMMHPAVTIPVTISHSANEAANQFVNATLTGLDGFTPRSFGMMMHGSAATMSFDNIDEGQYRVDVQNTANECVDSAWYGNVDLLHNYFVPTTGAQPIVINMRNDCATLTTKIDGTGSAVVVANGSMSQPRIVQANGRLTLSPGTYHVYAFTTLEGLEYANPEVMRDYLSQEVELDPNQKQDVTLQPVERKGN